MTGEMDKPPHLWWDGADFHQLRIDTALPSLFWVAATRELPDAPLTKLTPDRAVDRSDVRKRLESTKRLWKRGAEVSTAEMADQIIGLLAESGISVKDSDWGQR